MSIHSDTGGSHYHSVLRALLSIHTDARDAKPGDYLIRTAHGELLKVNIKPGIMSFNPDRFDRERAIKIVEPRVLELSERQEKK